MKNKSEVIIIRNHGGKIVELKVIPHYKRKNQKNFRSEKRVLGSMDTKILPEELNDLVETLDEQGKLSDLEKLLKIVSR